MYLPTTVFVNFAVTSKVYLDLVRNKLKRNRQMWSKVVEFVKDN